MFTQLNCPECIKKGFKKTVKCTGSHYVCVKCGLVVSEIVLQTSKMPPAIQLPPAPLIQRVKLKHLYSKVHETPSKKNQFLSAINNTYKFYDGITKSTKSEVEYLAIKLLKKAKLQSRFSYEQLAKALISIVMIKNQSRLISWCAEKSRIKPAKLIKLIRLVCDALQIPYPQQDIESYLNLALEIISKEVPQLKLNREKLLKKCKKALYKLQGKNPQIIVSSCILHEIKNEIPQRVFNKLLRIKALGGRGTLKKHIHSLEALRI